MKLVFCFGFSGRKLQRACGDGYFVISKRQAIFLFINRQSGDTMNVPKHNVFTLFLGLTLATTTVPQSIAERRAMLRRVNIGMTR